MAAPAVVKANVDRLILVGDDMRPLEEALNGEIAVERASDPEEAATLLATIVRPDDAVLVKASNSIGLARLVERMAGGLATCSM